jgi:tRNA uridine 5-carboxymethylaminomethyl modification enzyme
MFTSRAEYRLLLREDNADQRLTEKGRALGLVDDARWESYCRKMDAIAQETERLKTTWVQPGSAQAAAFTASTGEAVAREHSLLDLLRRPQVSYAQIRALGGAAVDDTVGEQIEIQARYAGYIDRQAEDVARLRRHEDLRLPADFDFDAVSGLSNEVRHKLKQVRPETLAQAGRIPGVTPAAVSLLMICLKKQGAAQALAQKAS